jgi:membrane protein DedA with SNARE-associated domain
MVQFAVDLINQIGLLGAGFLIAVEVVVLPIPSEVVLLLTGFNVSVGSFSFIGAVLATTAGSVAGASLLYGFGYGFSKARVELLIERFGKYVGISSNDLAKTFTWFDRYGTFVVFFGRLLPVIRSLVSIPAGLAQMALPKFLALTAAGSLIWNSIWISLGAALGAQWEQAETWAAVIDYVVYASAVVAVAVIALRLWQRKQKSK